jgi:hypothetical protein
MSHYLLVAHQLLVIFLTFFFRCTPDMDKRLLQIFSFPRFDPKWLICTPGKRIPLFHGWCFPRSVKTSESSVYCLVLNSRKYQGNYPLAHLIGFSRMPLFHYLSSFVSISPYGRRSGNPNNYTHNSMSQVSILLANKSQPSVIYRTMLR